MNLSFCTRLYETTTAFILEISGIAGVAFDRYRFGGEMGFDVVDQDFPCTDPTTTELCTKPPQETRFCSQHGK